MPFPEGWSQDAGIYRGPYPPQQGMRPKFASSLGTAVANLAFSEGAVVYRDVPGVDPQYREPGDRNHIWMKTFYIFNTGAQPLELSFDGVTVHYVLVGGGSGGYFFEDFVHAGFAVRRTVAGASSYVYYAF